MSTEEPRGAILRPGAAARAFEVERHAPSPAMAPFVQHYWFARWWVPDGEEHVQHILPLPAVNLTIERDAETITGPVSRRSEKRLTGRSRVFGVLFRPGGFQPFFRRSMHELVDRTLPVGALFEGDVSALREALWASVGLDRERSRQVGLLEAFLGEAGASPGPGIERVQAVVDAAREDRTLLRADALAERAGLSLRGLQRLLRRHLGLSPKLVLQRFRLQEAAHRLVAEPGLDQAGLALSLGYCDQAHFVRDFAAVIGEPPGRYAAREALG